MPFLLRSVFVFYFSLSILNLSAQSDSTQIYSLDSVVVVGKKNAVEIIPAQKLSGKILQNLSSQSVADAVRFFSGVQVKDYGGIGGLKTINIRSMGTNQMGVFYDGIQTGNAQNGQVDLGRFSLDNIESISIYNGQKSSMLQSAKEYGSAGTIYIQTLSPKFAENRRFNITARIKAGSFGVINPSFLYQQKLSDKASLSLSSEFMKAHGRYRFHFQSFATAKDTIAVRKNADITALRAELALFGYFGEGSWKVQIYNFNSERGLPGYVASNVFEHSERQWDNNFFVQGTLKKHFQNYSLLFNAKYAADYTRYMNPDTIIKLIDNHYNQNEIYLSLAQSYRPFKIWEIALATDFQFNNLFADRADFPFPTRYTLLTALSSSVKLQRAKFQASVLGTFVKDEVKKGISQKHKSELTPAVMASLSPFKYCPLDFRAFCKRIFRMPTFNDLYYTISTNSYLKPEFVQQYSIGAEYILFKNREQVTGKKDGLVQNFNISADFYYNFVENKIVAAPTSNPFRWQMMNLGKVKILGADFSADIELLLHKNLTLNVLANYSLQDARDYTDKNFYYRNLIPYVPQHCATFAANFNCQKFRLNYCLIYTGERYTNIANIPANYLRSFRTHDISAGYDIIFSKSKFIKKLMVNIDVNNVFNQHYEVVLNYPMPSTSFKAGVTLAF